MFVDDAHDVCGDVRVRIVEQDHERITAGETADRFVADIRITPPARAIIGGDRKIPVTLEYRSIGDPRFDDVAKRLAPALFGDLDQQAMRLAGEDRLERISKAIVNDPARDDALGRFGRRVCSLLSFLIIIGEAVIGRRLQHVLDVVRIKRLSTINCRRVIEIRVLVVIVHDHAPLHAATDGRWS
ncbi:MAG: hypothetical protein ACXIVE_02180 [Salinarimonas sp.]